LRCARCGNENTESNRFCGMCGATLLASAPQTGTPAIPPAQRPVQGNPTASRPIQTNSVPPMPPPSRPAPSAPPAPAYEEPTISGPSFLGLNQPAANRSRSGNLDYLLEDDGEEPKSGGAGKYVLIFAALILAAGLGYLRWKGQGFGWLGSSSATKPAATQTADGSDAGSPPNASSSSATPVSAPAPNGNSAATPTANAGTNAPASGNVSSSGASSANSTTASAPSSDSSTPNSSTPDSSAHDSSTPASSSATKSAPAGSEAPSSKAKAAPRESTNPDDAASDEDHSSSDPAKPAAAKPAPAKAKPSPLVAATPVDSIAEAQKYLYGKGVTQDCDRGLRMLKPQAANANPKAMIEMGALYSAGLCTPRDLPTAYRWFAMALRKDPNNLAVQTDLEKLWGEMTQPERQLAMKLSQ
jgi:hypothetical protein